MLNSTGVAVVVTNSVFLGIAVIAVFLRLLIHFRSSQGLGKDDWLIFFALCFSTGLCAVNIVGVPVGQFGKPYEEVNADGDTKIFLKFTFAWQFFYIFAVTFVKLSFLYFYGRFFHSHPFPQLQILLIWIVLAWAVTFLFTTIFQVYPISCNWFDCPSTMNYPIMYVCMSATAIMLDLAIFILPLVMLRKLELRRRRRKALAWIFGLGTFCVAASICRLAYTILFMEEFEQGQFAAQFASNFGTKAVSISMWSGIEACAGTICSCLPFFGPYFTKVPILQRLAISAPKSPRKTGAIDRYTGDLTTSRSRGRSRRPKMGLPAVNNGTLVSEQEGDLETAVVAPLGARKRSREHIIPPPPTIGSQGRCGKPTYRDGFEPEIEMGRISFRTGSSSGTTRS